MEFQASNYKTRDALDRAIKSRDPSKDDVILGTKDELSEKLLNESRKVYGVPVRQV